MGLERGAAYAAVAAAAAALLACAPALAGEAHAEQVPPWVKQVFGYYVDGQISEAELLAALVFLIDNGIMEVEAQGGSGGDRGIDDEGDFYVEYDPNPNSPRGSAIAYLQDVRLL